MLSFPIRFVNVFSSYFTFEKSGFLDDEVLGLWSSSIPNYVKSKYEW